MNRIVMVIGAALLMAALFFVNKGMNRNAKADHDDDEQQQSQPETPKPEAKKTAPPVRELLPAEISGGDMAKAKYKITLGWVYDARTQQHPEAADQAAISVFKFANQHQKDVAVEIVDLDVPLADSGPAAASVPGLGLSVTGGGVNLQIAGNAGEPPLTAPEIDKILAGLKF